MIDYNNARWKPEKKKSQISLYYTRLWRKMTKSSVARPKSSIPPFSSRVNDEKCMPSKYFTLLLFMSMLKLKLMKLKHSQIRLWKQLISKFQRLIHQKRYTDMESSPVNPLRTPVPAARPATYLAPSSRHSTQLLWPNAQLLGRAQPARFPQRLESVHSEYFNLKLLYSYSLKECNTS